MTAATLVFPEALLAFTLIGIVLGEAGHSGERVRLVTWTALIGFAGAMVETLLAYQHSPTSLFGGTFVVDGLSIFAKLVSIGLAAIFVVMVSLSSEVSRELRSEVCALAAAAALTVSIAVSASNLLLACLSLLATNLIGVILASFGRKAKGAAEAAFKQLVVASICAAALLFASAILFGHGGSASLGTIREQLARAPLSDRGSLIVLVLVLISFGAQLGVFPMHQASADTLDGSPSAVSAFLAMTAKIAGFVVFARIFLSVFARSTGAGDAWEPIARLDIRRILGAVAAITMIVGPLLAMRQSGTKRLVAGLMIGESGFLLLGVLGLTERSMAGALFLLTIQVLASMGVFFVLSSVVSDSGGDRIRDLRHAFCGAPLEAAALVFFLATLIGLPPTAGFIGKFVLLGATFEHEHHLVAILGLVSMAFASVAFGRVSYGLAMNLSSRGQRLLSRDRRRVVVLWAFIVPLAASITFAEPIIRWATRSLELILW